MKFIKSQKKYSKILFILFLVDINLFAKAKVKTIELDKIIARINDQVIFYTDIKQGVAQYIAQFGVSKEEAKPIVLKNMILSKLFLSKAGTNIEIDQSLIDVYYKDRLKQILARYGNSENRLEKSIKMNMEELRKVLKKSTTEMFIRDMMRGKLTRSVTISNKEVKEYLENTNQQNIPFHEQQICLKRIVKHLKVTDKERKGILKLLNNIKSRLRKGADFEDLAIEYSDDKISAERGGDIGYFWEPQNALLPKKYIEAVIKLSPIQNSKSNYSTSDIIETSHGMYIIQLLKRRGNTYRTRHILIKPKDLEGQKQNAIAELNKLKYKIYNNEISIDKYINSLDKESEDFKLSGFLKTKEGNIRFEKDKDEFPQNLNKSVFNLQEKSILGPFLTSTEEGIAMELIYIDNKLESRKANIKYDFDEISKVLLAQKKNNKIKEWILKAKAESIIYIDKDYKKYEEEIWK
ncbi:MAG: hypothetical protein GY830_03465 [Bacteroidetes bacterium]|nr:hypothetical protein [Bacteroidota bacterium]